MATTEHHERSGERSTIDVLSGITRHDLVLAIIPSAFVVAMLVGRALSLSTEAAIATASLVGALALVDALFLHPPETGDDT